MSKSTVDKIYDKFLYGEVERAYLCEHLDALIAAVRSESEEKIWKKIEAMAPNDEEFRLLITKDRWNRWNATASKPLKVLSSAKNRKTAREAVESVSKELALR